MTTSSLRLSRFLPASYPPSNFPTCQTAFLPTFQLSYASNSFLRRCGCLLAFLPAFQLSHPPSSFPTRQTAFLPTFQLSYPSNSFPTLPWLPSSFPTRLPPSYRLPTRRTAFLRLAAAFQLP